MTWGFSLLGALLLLFPGFCAWFGLRSGSRTDYLSPVPDKPNSTYTLFVVLLGALFAHTVGASLFALQEVYCRFRPCFLVEIANGTMRRLETETRAMPLMQILKAEIANVAFEIIDLSALLEQPSELPVAALA